mgnify:CR=1 FL=1
MMFSDEPHVEDLAEERRSDRVVRRFYRNRLARPFYQYFVPGRHEYLMRLVARSLPQAAAINGHRRIERQLVGFRMCF